MMMDLAALLLLQCNKISHPCASPSVQIVRGLTRE